MTIEDLRSRGLIIFEVISGSKAYGLDTPTSDTDLKGIFLLPKKEYYGLNYIPQVSNETNDVVFYEMGRFLELLSLNNPNIMELLNTPDSCILYKHPILSEINSDKILSKLCNATFGNFALSQIKKAKGLNKKIVNPVEKDRKSVVEFCYVNKDGGSISLVDYLNEMGWNQQHCGLVKISNMKDIYGLYHSSDIMYNGVIKGTDSNDVSLSSIPKGQKQLAVMYFNRDGYSSYCKDYKEYWDWVEKRNEARYENTMSHGKNYDSKNMMHVFRLLDMAIEIGRDKRVNVRRPNREFLLDVKAGIFDYDKLMDLANKKKLEMEIAFQKTDLPEKPDLNYINNLAFNLREKFYTEK